MEEQFPDPSSRSNEELVSSEVEQEHTEQVEVIVDGQVFRKTVLPAFTRDDAVRRHSTMMRAHMNDTRYQRPHRRGRNGVVDFNNQDRYYDN